MIKAVIQEEKTGCGIKGVSLEFTPCPYFFARGSFYLSRIYKDIDFCKDATDFISSASASK